MLPIKRILVPVMYSARCAWAARYADGLAKACGSQLIFLNVSQNKDICKLEQFVSQETGATYHDSVVADGDAAERIVDLAREYDVDLIVMPTHHGQYQSLLLGSFTAKVLRNVQCAVFTGVHLCDDSPQIPVQFRRIVCGLDHVPGCVSLFHWAGALADLLSCRLSVVHAIPALDETSGDCGEVQVRRYLLDHAESEFRTRFSAQAKQPPVDLKGGRIATVIREAVLADGADLIVIGRGHVNLMGRLRTHTCAIIRSAPCPVISVLTKEDPIEEGHVASLLDRISADVR
jgi:nucleotide-binding universal stress UspA family protein